MPEGLEHRHDAGAANARGQRSVDALNVPTEDGYEIVPKTEAKALVSYLLTLDKSHPLKEVKTATPEVAAK